MCMSVYIFNKITFHSKALKFIFVIRYILRKYVTSSYMKVIGIRSRS